MAFILISEEHCIVGDGNSFPKVAIWFASGLIRLVCVPVGVLDMEIVALLDYFTKVYIRRK